MIIPLYIAILFALGVLVMMRQEIMNGFFRWRDYLLTTPLLYMSALLLIWLDGVIAALDPSLWIISMPLRAMIAFSTLVVVWGGTLTLGSLILRLLIKPLLRT